MKVKVTVIAVVKKLKVQELTTWLDVLDPSSHTRAYRYNESHKLASN